MENGRAHDRQRPDWFTDRLPAFRFLLELIGPSARLHSIATSPETPGEDDNEEMLDFLMSELQTDGLDDDYEPTERGHKIEALIDVFNDLLPDD